MHPTAPGPAGAAVPTEEAATCARELIETIPAVHRRIGRRVRRSTTAPLSVPQLRALRFFQRHPGGSISAVAEHLGVGLPAASALVERLVRAGWVERQVDPTERRRMVVRLTRDGAARLDAAEAAARQWLADLLTGYPRDELAVLRRAAGLLRRLVEAMDAEPEGTDTEPSRGGAPGRASDPEGTDGR